MRTRERSVGPLTPGLILGIWLLPCASAGAWAQEERPPVQAARAPSVRLEGLVQVQTASTPVDSSVQWDVELRRIRVTLDASEGDLSGRIMVDTDASRARVRDAYIRYRAAPALEIQVGQFKTPFDPVQLESARSIPTIERGVRIRGLDYEATTDVLADAHYGARNRSVMLTLSPSEDWRLYAAGGLGSGEAGENDDGKQVALRIERRLTVLHQPVGLNLGVIANGFFGGPTDTLVTIGDAEVPVRDPVYGTGFEAWIEVGDNDEPGLRLLAQVVSASNPFAPRLEDDKVELARLLGIAGWVEYRWETAWGPLDGVAPAFRWDRLDPDDDADDDAGWLLTPGLNLYFEGGSLLVQTALDIVNLPSDRTEAAFRMQTQLRF